MLLNLLVLVVVIVSGAVVGYVGDLCLFGFAVLVWFLGGLAGFCYCGCGMDST